MRIDEDNGTAEGLEDSDIYKVEFIDSSVKIHTNQGTFSFTAAEFCAINQHMSKQALKKLLL